jgi:hypothetical protein
LGELGGETQAAVSAFVFFSILDGLFHQLLVVASTFTKFKECSKCFAPESVYVIVYHSSNNDNDCLHPDHIMKYLIWLELLPRLPELWIHRLLVVKLPCENMELIAGSRIT